MGLAATVANLFEQCLLIFPAYFTERYLLLVPLKRKFEGKVGIGARVNPFVPLAVPQNCGNGI